MPIDMHAPDRDPDRVKAMFGRVARRYRLANTILSGGMDYFWRQRASAIVQGWKPARILDVATGSGDLARTLERSMPGTEVTGADFSPEMLDVARQLGSKRLVQADALALPFESETFDAAGGRKLGVQVLSVRLKLPDELPSFESAALWMALAAVLLLGAGLAAGLSFPVAVLSALVLILPCVYLLGPGPVRWSSGFSPGAPSSAGSAC